MLVMTGSRGEHQRWPGLALIASHVRHLPERCHVVLEFPSMSGPNVRYAQAKELRGGRWEIEYRDGSPALHFLAHTTDTEAVARALSLYAANHYGESTEDWKAGLVWENIGAMFRE